MITKTDFLDFLKTPMHLWASKHDQIEKGTSPYDQHRMEQGKEIENLARQFIKEHLLHGATAEIEHEKTFINGNFQARVDTVACYPDEGLIDIYEIKSSSFVKKEDKYDVAFQRVVCEASVTVRDVYIAHLNKDYIRQGEIELAELFIVDNINEDIEDIREEVLAAREEAYSISMLDTPDQILACVKPDKCPCPTFRYLPFSRVNIR